MILKKLLRRFPQNTFYILLNGQSKTLFTIFLISSDNTSSANLFADVLLSLGFFMSFTTYDSGRIFYLELLKNKEKYRSLRNYFLRKLTITIPVIFVSFFLLIRLDYGLFFTALILALFITEKLFDEYQRFLVTIVGHKKWLNLIKRKSISQFFLVCITCLLILFFNLSSKLIISIAVLSIIISNIFSLLNSYSLELFKNNFIAIFRNVRKENNNNNLTKFFLSYMNLGGSNGGLMMALEPIVSSFSTNWVKLILFTLMPNIKYIVNLIYTFAGGIETYFSAESLVTRRKKFLNNTIDGKDAPLISANEKFNVILLSLLSSFITCLIIKNNLILNERIGPMNIFILTIFIWTFVLSISSVIKAYEYSWLHYRYPGLPSLIISGFASLTSLSILSMNFLTNANNFYFFIIFSSVISLCIEVLVYRSKLIRDKLESINN